MKKFITLTDSYDDPILFNVDSILCVEETLEHDGSRVYFEAGAKLVKEDPTEILKILFPEDIKE